MVDSTASVFSITTQGLERFERIQAESATRFLSGRDAVRRALEQSVGGVLSDDDFQRIWSVFEERIAQHFHARGQTLVAEVSAIVEGRDASDGPASQAVDQLSFLDELAAAVGSTSTHAQRREELAQAVRDIFMDRASAATDWLAK